MRVHDVASAWSWIATITTSAWFVGVQVCLFVFLPFLVTVFIPHSDSEQRLHNIFIFSSSGESSEILFFQGGGLRLAEITI